MKTAKFTAIPIRRSRLDNLNGLRNLVLGAVPSPNSKRAYDKGLDTFFAWQIEAGTPSMNRATVQAFRTSLEARHLSPSTIGVYLSAVRRLANEAVDKGLLEPQIAAGISKVPNVKNRGAKVGTWLTPEETGRLLRLPDCSTLKGCRDRAVLSLLVACALRRAELARLSMQHFQMRDAGWVLSDLIGKGRRVRTVPVPAWVKLFIDEWTAMAGIRDGRMFRPVNKGGRLSGDGISEDTVWTLTRDYGARIGKPNLSPHDLRRTCARLCRASGGALEQIQLLLGHASVQTTERYLGTRQELARAVNDNLPIPLTGTVSEPSRKGPQRACGGRFEIAAPDEPVSSLVDGAGGSR